MANAERISECSILISSGQQLHAASLLDRLLEIRSILSQAHSAAHLYEELSRKGDSALAEQGLERFDVPRAAYHELTKGL